MSYQSVSPYGKSSSIGTHYMGSRMHNQAYYQRGAKIHKMTAQASLAAVVFSYVRYEMASDRVFNLESVLRSSNITSYLWSVEFWGSISSNHLAARRRIVMSLIITTAIILAAIVGPSSAILLVPRLEHWPSGCTDIWLDAIWQDLWPNR